MESRIGKPIPVVETKEEYLARLDQLKRYLHVVFYRF